MPRGLAAKTLDLIEAAATILDTIQPATVRGVCYKLFVAGLIPDMSKRSTNRVGTALKTARERGDIPWDWIVDEGRAVERVPSWTDPVHFVGAVKQSYRRDYWRDQPTRVIVVSEKSTIRGIVMPVLVNSGVGFLALHGYGSVTALHDLAVQSAADDRETVLVYVGDHDPSGRHMSDVDLPSRIAKYGGVVTVERVALTDTDLDALSTAGLGFSALTKRKDPRYRWFAEHYDDRCAELDALDPNDLRTRVQDAIERRIDWGPWYRATAIEMAELRSIDGFITDWQNLFSGKHGNSIGGTA